MTHDRVGFGRTPVRRARGDTLSASHHWASADPRWVDCGDTTGLPRRRAGPIHAAVGRTSAPEARDRVDLCEGNVPAWDAYDSEHPPSLVRSKPMTRKFACFRLRRQAMEG